MALPVAERDNQLEPEGDDMDLKLSETSCIFRQVPLTRMKPRAVARSLLAANDNVVCVETDEASSADHNLSLAEVGPILVLLAISGGTFYVISAVLSGYLRSFLMFFP